MTAATSFEYGVSRLRDIKVHTGVNKAGHTVVDHLTLNDRPVKQSNRFWLSLQCRFGFTQNIFKYFGHEEVFERISKKAPNDELRWCIENNESAVMPTMLAVTNPRASAVRHDDLSNLFNRFGNEEVSYANGIVRSTHAPRYDAPFSIAGDDFRSKFVIDGFGRPAIYLSLLRQICANGAVAYTPAFRSELSTGKGVEGATFALVRALEGFNNEEGFAALRQRFESSTRSWASVAEVNRLYKLLLRLFHGKQLSSNTPSKGKKKVIGGDGASLLDGAFFSDFHKMTGDLTQIYGLANIDALSVKRQRTLPAACRVYDLLNFTSELATHHAGEAGARNLQAFIGQVVSAEYDLEGTADQFANWKDFFIKDEAAIDTITKAKMR
jgi:hypothetical protein